MAASKTALEKQEALTRGTTAKNNLDNFLAAGGYEQDLQATLVPVAYKVVVTQAPGSGLTLEQARTLANTTLNLELYEES